MQITPYLVVIYPLLCITHALGPASNQYGNGSSNLPPPPASRGSMNLRNDDDYIRTEPGSSWMTNESPQFQNESIEERLAAWREQQQYKYEHQSMLDASNPRDEDGKMKLLASVSKGSVAIFFFILMWRSVHHYELADQTFQGTTRLFMVLPPVVLFLGNMAGCVGSILSNGTIGKKRLKAILNLNKLMEIVLMFYNVMRLVVVPSKLVVREVYVGRTLSNFLFLVQCQLFTKVTWNAAKPSSQQQQSVDRVYGSNTGSAFDGVEFDNGSPYGYASRPEDDRYPSYQYSTDDFGPGGEDEWR